MGHLGMVCSKNGRRHMGVGNGDPEGLVPVLARPGVPWRGTDKMWTLFSRDIAREIRIIPDQSFSNLLFPCRTFLSNTV